MARDFFENELLEYLIMQKQHELIESYENLTPLEKERFLIHIDKLNYQYPDIISPLEKPKALPTENLKPFAKAEEIEDQAIQVGIHAIKKELVATLILAGGDGSRLSFDKPKACFPISPIKKKTLIDLKLEKLISTFSGLNLSLPVFLLTSESNIKPITTYLEHQSYFSKLSSLFEIIEQPSLPFVSDKNKWFLSDPGVLAKGPNGNGGFIQALFQSGGFEQLEKRGVKYLVVTSIDNPLSDPFDAALIGTHILKERDISFYCYKRASSEEKTGLVAYKQDRLTIVDYNHFNDTLYEAKKDHQFVYAYGNTNIFCFSLSFLRKSFEEKKLTVHWVKKKMQKFDVTSQSYYDSWGWKGEKFITDLISFTKNAGTICKDRIENFAPLKSLHGPNGVDSVHETIFEKNRHIYEKLTGKKTAANFELAMKYYTPFATPTFPKDGHLDGLYID